MGKLFHKREFFLNFYVLPIGCPQAPISYICRSSSPSRKVAFWLRATPSVTL